MANRITKDEFRQMLLQITGVPADDMSPINPNSLYGMQAQALEAQQRQLQAQQRQLQASNALVDYMNPYANMNYQQILQEYTNKGLDSLKVIIQNTPMGLRAAKARLNIADNIPELSDQLLRYNQGKSSFADQGFERKAFDVYVKTDKLNSQGVPLQQTYKYIPKSIPEAHVKFDGKHYNLTQGGAKMTMKNFKDIERIALKGGDYSEELTVLRDVRRKMEKREEPFNVVFKSRKV